MLNADGKVNTNLVYRCEMQRKTVGSGFERPDAVLGDQPTGLLRNLRESRAGRFREASGHKPGATTPNSWSVVS